VCFDLEAPALELKSDSDFEKWTSEDIDCILESRDDKSGIHTIEIKTDEEFLFEKAFEQEEGREDRTEFLLDREAECVEGRELTIIVSDFAGNTETILERYYIDKIKPTLLLSGISDGAIFQDPAVLDISVQDNLTENALLFYKAVKTVGGKEQILEEIPGSADGSVINRIYEEDGMYELTYYAEDKAGNCSGLGTLRFRMDRTSPGIFVSGVLNGTDYQTACSVNITVSESFFEDCHVEIKARRLTPGKEEAVSLPAWKTYGEDSENSCFFGEDGDYEILIEAVDAAGNRAEKEVWFRIDQTAPLLEIEGLAEDTVTNIPPTITFHMEELFYDTAAIQCLLLRKAEDGSYMPVMTPIWEPGSGNEDFLMEVKEEGCYELTAVATDRSNHRTEKKLRFTLDYTPPVIGYLDTLHRKYFKSFRMPAHFASDITDLTQVNYAVYLNTRNLLPDEEITEDGKYILRVEAADEAGNRSEKTVEFIVDQTMPHVVVKGTRKDGTVGRNEKLTLSLYEEEDTFVSVFVNGIRQKLDGEKKEAVIRLLEYGDYELEVKAVDPAQNELTKIIKLKCALAASPFTEYKVTEKIIRQEDVKTGRTEGKQWIILAAVLFVLAGTAVFFSCRLYRIHKIKLKRNRSGPNE
ncbi:MAG TPA: hypothetical protein PLU43_05735, partial [Lachnospiraceae bacterium]|nr:hypothetical protein [Lachnospiraceae bacterium]